MGLFDSIFGGGTDTSALRSGAQQAGQDIQNGKTNALTSIKNSVSQATPVYQQGAAAFQPFQANGVQGSNMLANGLGLNGQTGYDAATGAFHQGPGYQFALDQANQNILRNGAATGGVANGNVLTALQDRAQGMQNQEYGNWLSQLQGLSGQGLQGATGQANELNQLGNMYQTAGQNKANIQTGAAGALATNASSLGAGLQSQNAADQASQLSLLNSILGAGAKAVGAGGFSLPGGAANYASALLGGSGGWNTTVTPGG